MTTWGFPKIKPTHSILPADAPLAKQGGIAVLRGNLAPNGAVLKPSAASPHLLTHRGRAVVFEDIDDYKARIAEMSADLDRSVGDQRAEMGRLSSQLAERDGHCAELRDRLAEAEAQSSAALTERDESIADLRRQLAESKQNGDAHAA